MSNFSHEGLVATIRQMLDDGVQPRHIIEELNVDPARLIKVIGEMADEGRETKGQENTVLLTNEAPYVPVTIEPKSDGVSVQIETDPAWSMRIFSAKGGASVHLSSQDVSHIYNLRDGSITVSKQSNVRHQFNETLNLSDEPQSLSSTSESSESESISVKPEYAAEVQSTQKNNLLKSASQNTISQDTLQHTTLSLDEDQKETIAEKAEEFWGQISGQMNEGDDNGS